MGLAGASKIRVVLLGGLAEDIGVKTLEVEGSTWREALLKLRGMYGPLREVIDDDGSPKPGFLVFIDGVDSRIAGEKHAREVVILPVNHGGSSIEVEYVSWIDVEKLSYLVADAIAESGFHVDVIVGIMRGGIIPARIIADKLGVNRIETLEVKLYRKAGVREEKPYVVRPIIGELRGLNVLIVDDISDSGLTLESAVNLVSLYAPRAVRTATLYIKPWTRLVPDYYAATTRKWVVFPWEKFEIEREAKEEAKDA